MGETADQTRREIDRLRKDLTDTVSLIETEIRAALDWKAHVRARPWMYIGIALAAGFVVSGGPFRLVSHGLRAFKHEPRTPLERVRLASSDRLADLGEVVQERLGDVMERIPVGAAVVRQSDGAITRVAIGPPPPMWERLALRAGETAATTAASLLVNRLIQELKGQG